MVTETVLSSISCPDMVTEAVLSSISCPDMVTEMVLSSISCPDMVTEMVLIIFSAIELCQCLNIETICPFITTNCFVTYLYF
jgi:hypothetical protein